MGDEIGIREIVAGAVGEGFESVQSFSATDAGLIGGVEFGKTSTNAGELIGGEGKIEAERTGYNGERNGDGG